MCLERLNNVCPTIKNQNVSLGGRSTHPPPHCFPYFRAAGFQTEKKNPSAAKGIFPCVASDANCDVPISHLIYLPIWGKLSCSHGQVVFDGTVLPLNVASVCLALPRYNVPTHERAYVLACTHTMSIEIMVFALFYSILHHQAREKVNILLVVIEPTGGKAAEKMDAVKEKVGTKGSHVLW